MVAADGGFRGTLAVTPLPQVLRRIFLEGRKGTLRVFRQDERRNLFFEKGELRSATSSREAQKIGAFLKRRGFISDRDLAWALETVSRHGRRRLGKLLVEKNLVSAAVLDAEMRRLVEEIVFSTFEWKDGDYVFEPSTGVLDPDVALNLSTAAVIVQGIRRLPEGEGFRELLGDGKRVPVLAPDPVSRYQYLALTPQEAYLLSRVDGIVDLDALLKIGGPSRAAAAKTLYALVSCGIVQWKGQELAPPAAGLERLNVEVSAGPALRPPEHSELVRHTYRRIDWLTHYELLGVRPQATADEIRAAFFERSRLFHPDLRHRPDLADCEKELTTVFARLSTAHGVLSDPAERAAYDASLAAPAGLAFEIPPDPRQRVELAAKNYARARKLIEEKDYFTAVEMLREAIHFVPDNAEYRFCLARVELQNAHWIERGLENLVEAARLDPKRQRYLQEAARALHEHGRSAEAVVFARRATNLNPSPQNEELLSLVLGEHEGPALPLENAAEEVAAEPSPEMAGRPRGLLARLFRRRP